MGIAKGTRLSLARPRRTVENIMDKYCAKCGMEWDEYAVIDQFVISREGPGVPLRFTKADSGRVVTDNEGYPWILYFDTLDDFREGHFLIEQCLNCEPTVGQDDCELCHGLGKLFAWRLKGDSWKSGSGSHIVPCSPPFRRNPNSVCKDGVLYHGVTHCHVCFESQERCLQAMADAGWNEKTLTLEWGTK